MKHGLFKHLFWVVTVNSSEGYYKYYKYEINSSDYGSRNDTKFVKHTAYIFTTLVVTNLSNQNGAVSG